MDKVLTKYTSRGAIVLLLKDFVFQINFIIFSNFFALGSICLSRILQCIMSKVSSLYITISTAIKIN